MSKPPARSWMLGALLWGVASLATAADVTVQPAAGSGFVVKDSGGATDRFRVQDNGQVSLPSVPAAATQAQGLCIAASGVLGPCAGGGGGGSYTAGTGLALTGSAFSVAPPYQLPQACAANQIPQWNGAAWICGNGGGGGGLGGGGTASYLPVWSGPTTLANSYVTQTSYGFVGIGVNGLLQNQLQVGDPPSFSGNSFAIGNGAQGMSFSLTAAATTWFSNTSFSLKSTVGDALVGIGGIPTHNLDVFGGNAQIGLVNNSNSTSATISKYTNRLEISPVEAFQVSVGGLARPHFWIDSSGKVGVGTTSPASSLQVGSVGATGYSGHDIAFGNGTQASGIKQTASVAQWYSTTDIALMPHGNGHGRVGINTTPSYPLEVSDYVTAGPLLFSYLKDNPNGVNPILSACVCTANVSIYASDNVMALEFDARSDARIKDPSGISNSARDLETIKALEVTDYTLRDKVRYGDKPFKKVIAQQVERVYPQVVSQHVDFIPNVYRTASAVTKTAAGTLLHFDTAHGLSPGAKRLKLLASGDQSMQKIGILSIPSTRDVVIDVPQLNGNKVFVYGEEVNDFRTVDYEGLTTLNISATQEIAKRLAKQQADLAALSADKDAQLAHLREQLSKQQARVAELESVAADLAEIRAQLAVLKRNTAPAQWHDAALRP